MDACLQPQVSCCLIMTIIRQRKKDIRKIEKKKSKNTVKRTLGLCTTFLCVCGLYLHIIVCGHISEF